MVRGERIRVFKLSARPESIPRDIPMGVVSPVKSLVERVSGEFRNQIYSIQSI